MKGYLQTSHWSDVTTGEVGSMVREAVKRGEDKLAEEARGERTGTSKREIRLTPGTFCSGRCSFSGCWPKADTGAKCVQVELISARFGQIL